MQTKYLATLLALMALTPSAAFAASTIFVADQNEIIKYSTSGGPGTIYGITNGTTQSGIGFNSSGTLFTSSRDTNSIYALTPNVPFATVTTFASLNSPAYGLAIDGSDDVYVDKLSGGIQEYSPDGSASRSFETGVAGVSLAFNLQGDLFQANGSGTIFEYAPDGTRTTFATNAGTEPLGMAIDASGNVFVSNWSGQIFEYSPTGTQSLFATYDSSQMLSLGLAIDDSTGILYMSAVANGTSQPGQQKILQFSPQGVESVFATGLNGPFGITVQGDFLPSVPGESFSSTPEPASMTLLFTGIGAMYTARRARKRISVTSPAAKPQ